jgi:acetyl esterase/lipase
MVVMSLGGASIGRCYARRETGKDSMLKRKTEMIPSSQRKPVLAATFLIISISACSGRSGPDLGQGVQNIATCHGVEEALVDPRPAGQVFEQEGGTCSAAPAVDDLRPGNYFADLACRRPFSYYGTSFDRFCNDNLIGTEGAKKKIGNPERFRRRELEPGKPVETRWTSARGAGLDVAAAKADPGVSRPFVKKLEYRRVGACSLAMHVYKKDPTATDLKPALVIHGGGWRYRGAFSIAAIETIAPQLTSRGYVVFSPFYRLLGNSDGPVECRNADGRAIEEDVVAALAWVREHGGEFGVATPMPKVVLVGQSAGAHLSAFLAVEQPEAIERVLLLYPPTDFRHTILGLQPGGIYESRLERSRGLIARFVNQPGIIDAAALDPTDPFVGQNSFPERVAADPTRFPPFEMIHGDIDSIVPVENSLRLCQAAAGEALVPGAYGGGDLDRACGPGRLKIVTGAEHILDLRCFTGHATELGRLLYQEVGKACPAGSADAAASVRLALESFYGRI